MSISTSISRQCFIRALARSTNLNNTARIPQRKISSVSTAIRSLSQQRLPCQTVQATRALSVGHLPVHRGYRLFSSGDAKDGDSDDDFKPKRKLVSDNAGEIADLIKTQVESNPIMVYMKGTPSEPRCGFSGRVVRILHIQGVSFSSVNVLDYPSIREGVKAYTEWPTVPQVFVKGEFVGGCDIMMQMHESGELETMFKEAKLRE